MSDKASIIFSIIIPVYQAKDTLKRCVLSCLNQKFVGEQELQIILVDDGSTDGSAQICDELEKGDAFGRISVLHGPNHGVSHARNLGLERATGRYVAFVDADDSVKEDYLENMLKYADDSTVIIAETDSYASNQKLSGFQFIENVILGSDTHVWGKLFDRKTIKDGGILFNEDLTIGEDLLFLMDIALLQGKKHTIRCIPSGDYLYTENQQGAMKSSFKATYMDELVCWKRAEEKLWDFRREMSPYAFVLLAVSQIMTAFLVIGKVAVLQDEEKDKELCDLAVSKAKAQISHALKTHGAFAGLSVGYKLKVMLFNMSPGLYLKMYGRRKRN